MNEAKQNKLNRGSLGEVLLATAFQSKGSGVYILVDSRPVVLEKMNSLCYIFSNYPVSIILTVDIMAGADFYKK